MNHRGYALLEMMMYLALTVGFFTIMVKTYQAFEEAHFRVVDATSDLETATRLLDDIKEDLRFARGIEVTPSTLALRLQGGRKITYEFIAKDQSVMRTGTRYARTFEAVSFRRTGRIVTLEVELLRPVGGSGMRPRLEAVVFCRNLEE